MNTEVRPTDERNTAGTEVRPCPQCEGKGWITAEFSEGTYSASCPNCSGSGKVEVNHVH